MTTDCSLSTVLGSGPAFLSGVWPMCEVAIRTQVFLKPKTVKARVCKVNPRPVTDDPAEAGTREEEPRGRVPGQMCPPQQGPGLPAPPPAAPLLLPFQVFQQEEEGDEVGVGQGTKQVHHAVFLGSRVRQGCGDSGARVRLGSRRGGPHRRPHGQGARAQ